MTKILSNTITVSHIAWNCRYGNYRQPLIGSRCMGLSRLELRDLNATDCAFAIHIALEVLTGYLVKDMRETRIILYVLKFTVNICINVKLILKTYRF